MGLLSLHRALDSDSPFLLNRSQLDPNWIGQQVEAAGFGEDYDVSTTASLRFASLRIVEIDEFGITVDGLGAQGLCFGDSGAPIFAKNMENQSIVLGIASHGDASCLGRDYLIRVDVRCL